MNPLSTLKHIREILQKTNDRQLLKLPLFAKSAQATRALQKRIEDLGAIGTLAAIYFLAGKLGLSLAFVHFSSAAVWPPAGITLAAFLILGHRVWPGIFLGSFFVNITTTSSILTSIGIAAGNTIGGVVGTYLVSRFANGRKSFDNGQDILKFAILAGMLSTTVSATFGVTSLFLGGFASWSHYKLIWLTWWLGDAVGDVVVAPLLILWSSDRQIRLNWTRLTEFVILIVCVLLVGQVVFCDLFLTRANNYPIEYLCIPFLMWAAFRFGQREAATVTAILSGIAVWGTLQGFGPFVRGTGNESILLLQAFMGVVAVMTIALAAEYKQRQSEREQAQHLAATDSLTGLANYGEVVAVLDAEIKRSGRTGRPFALVLLDLDGLKKINDQHGHLAGSRALCRLADVLRFSCRGIDTPARYGGDEFAIVMPESGAASAERVARRICEGVAKDLEQPRLSVSVGTAVYPHDGETSEMLFSAADRALYEMKGRSRKELLLSAPGPHPGNE